MWRWCSTRTWRKSWSRRALSTRSSARSRPCVRMRILRWWTISGFPWTAMRRWRRSPRRTRLWLQGRYWRRASAREKSWRFPKSGTWTGRPWRSVSRKYSCLRRMEQKWENIEKEENIEKCRGGSLAYPGGCDSGRLRGRRRRKCGGTGKRISVWMQSGVGGAVGPSGYGEQGVRRMGR